MPSLNYSLIVAGLGASINANFSREGDGGGVCEIAVPKGKTGTLTTRTDNETGTLTMSSGHGITTGQFIDLYWATGIRRGITVGTVSVNSVPIGADNSGSGNNLPSASTAIVACPQLVFNATINYSTLVMLAVQQTFAVQTETANSNFEFRDDNSPANLLGAALTLEPNIARVFDVEGGDSAPGAGGIIMCAVSNGSSVYDATLKLIWVEDATP
jgi:hypothetical protein